MSHRSSSDLLLPLLTGKTSQAMVATTTGTAVRAIPESWAVHQACVVQEVRSDLLVLFTSDSALVLPEDAMDERTLRRLFAKPSPIAKPAGAVGQALVAVTN